MSEEEAKELLMKHTKHIGNPYKFIKYVEPDYDGAILLCELETGERIEVGVYPDIAVALPE